jgi:hypothetical protein
MAAANFQHPHNKNLDFNPNSLRVTRLPRILASPYGPVFDGGLEIRGIVPGQDPWAGILSTGRFTWDQKNVEIMLNGQPPWGRDGYKMQLHHRNNQANGPIDEYSWTIHKQQHGLLHDPDSSILAGAIGHFEDRSDYDGQIWKFQRGRFWVTRALCDIEGTTFR